MTDSNQDVLMPLGKAADRHVQGAQSKIWREQRFVE